MPISPFSVCDLNSLAGIYCTVGSQVTGGNTLLMGIVFLIIISVLFIMLRLQMSLMLGFGFLTLLGLHLLFGSPFTEAFYLMAIIGAAVVGYGFWKTLRGT